MPRMLQPALLRAMGFATVGSLFGCNTVIGLNKLSIETAVGSDATSSDASLNNAGCTTNAECTEQATAAAANDPANSTNDGGSQELSKIEE